MRLVRRRGLAWREAAKKAAQAQHTASNATKDKWSELLQQLKETKPCDHPACRGNHKPGQPHQYDYAPIRRESRASAVQRAAEQEEEFRGFTNRLLVVLALLLAGLTGVVLYSL
ncbi:uncharacterized protein LOC135217544, partial [Macrobrachium nipponense]|uniref:uncharacterized protein LOC135217544 n=1 Tax=Macrobrachium nipponense TaxID=159736 RepID=UPI0030C87A2E